MWPARKPAVLLTAIARPKTPANRNTSGRECKQIAFDHQKSADLHIDLPVVAAVVAFELSLRMVEPLTDLRAT